MEKLATMALMMALPAALFFVLAIGDIVMDIIYCIFPGFAEREEKEIERNERWQEEEE